jgi:hypothetical protein
MEPWTQWRMWLCDDLAAPNLWCSPSTTSLPTLLSRPLTPCPSTPRCRGGEAWTNFAAGEVKHQLCFWGHRVASEMATSNETCYSWWMWPELRVHIHKLVYISVYLFCGSISRYLWLHWSNFYSFSCRLQLSLLMGANVTKVIQTIPFTPALSLLILLVLTNLFRLINL